MIKHLVQYFIQNDHLDLPGVGAIKWSKQEAFWKEGVLIAPKEQIVFDPISSKPSKQFYNFLADELGISTDQAMLKFESFVENFTSQTISDLVLGNIGTLHKNASKITWESNFDDKAYYKDLDLSSTAQSQFIANQNAGLYNDKWWIWSLLIALLAAGLIVYKYY